MKWREGGETFGIDPYLRAAARQDDDHGRSMDLAQWSDDVDWEALFGEVTRRIGDLGLDTRCHLVRDRSEDVADQFAPGSIDLLHIDGNHDRAAVMRDAALYVPRISVGGYVVLDDANWSSVRPVYRHLCDNHELVFQLFDANGVTAFDRGGNDFAIFRIHGVDGHANWPSSL
jgi:hypothetical protein